MGERRLGQVHRAGWIEADAVRRDEPTDRRIMPQMSGTSDVECGLVSTRARE
jgi:hypothetical protein